MFEKPIVVEHLHVFWCDAYTHVAKDEVIQNQESYGEAMKVIKTLYDPSISRVLCSRDANVHFKEVRYDSKQELCREQNRKYVKLEFTTDDITDDHFENKIAPPETNTNLS